MSRRESLLSARYQTRPPKAGDAPRSGRALRRLSLAATVAALLTIALGALVRTTGSGDACGDDWPVCNGRIIPELDANVLIEYTHRLATPVLIVLIGGLAVTAWRRHRRERGIVGPATAALALLFAQAALGALVVVHGLSPVLVTFHLATAMALVGTLVYVTVVARSPSSAPGAPTAGAGTRKARRAEAAGVARRAWFAAGAVLAVVLAGAYVRGEGAGLAFLDWPLMDGRVVPDLDSAATAAQFVHRLLAAAAIPLVAMVSARAARARGERPAVFGFAALAAAALVAQILVGAANVWSRLAVPAAVAHVVLASIVWAALVGTAAAARTAREPERA